MDGLEVKFMIYYRYFQKNYKFFENSCNTKKIKNDEIKKNDEFHFRCKYESYSL